MQDFQLVTIAQPKGTFGAFDPDLTKHAQPRIYFLILGPKSVFQVHITRCRQLNRYTTSPPLISPTGPQILLQIEETNSAIGVTNISNYLIVNELL